MASQTAPTVALAPEAIQVRCPQCKTGHVAHVHTIVDASDESARGELLSGRLNVSTCPACGVPSRVDSPILYHDGTAEVAFVLVPQSLNLPHDEQERAIGRLTNRLLSQLPAESRRMYILQPKTFISEETFVTAVLESMGISPDDLRQAQQSAQLVESLLKADSDADLDAALEAAGSEAAYGLILMISQLAEQADAAGDPERAKGLVRLRDRLVDRSGIEVSFDQILKLLAEAHSEGRLTDAVAQIRGVLDYQFFAALTQRIDSSTDAGEKERLAGLRTAILEASDEVDATVRSEIEAATDILRAALSQPDPVAALREKVDVPSGALLVVIDANLEAATKEGQDDVVHVLEAMRNAVILMIEEGLPPKQRLVNRLARTLDPAAQDQLLTESPELLDEELMQMISETVAAARSSGLEQVAVALEQASARIAARNPSAGGPE
jgi:hypothetical protein